MLTKKQIGEIREHLDRAQNPVFFYDNDADGLCSYLLLRRYTGRGKGVAVKSYPELNVQYAHKVQEFKSDYVFVLDKPVIGDDFFKEIERMQIPLVWIDHHDIVMRDDIKKSKFVEVYNPAILKGKNKSSEPVTYIVYKVLEKKEDIWIAMMGCIADHYLPSFADEFKEGYPTYWAVTKEPFTAYYNTEIGRLAQSLSFGLKDSISHVVALQNFLIGCKGPDDIFLELEGNRSFREKYRDIRKKYDILLADAQKCIEGRFLFFIYSGDLSISAEIANELSYRYPALYIAVAYRKEGICNISLRGNYVKKILEKVLKRLGHGSGGGHENAVGARISTNDLEKFREYFEEAIA